MLECVSVTYLNLYEKFFRLMYKNVELNTELERFVQTDEQIRTTLNRRDRVDHLRYAGESKMRESYANLERASPRRRGSPTQTGYGRH